MRAPVLGKATVEGGVAAVFYGPSVPTGTNPDVPVPNSVRVVLVRGSDAHTWFNDYRGKVHAISLTGLGDQAYYDGYASVRVLKGDAYVRIAVASPRGILLASEKKLAADEKAKASAVQLAADEMAISSDEMALAPTTSTTTSTSTSHIDTYL